MKNARHHLGFTIIEVLISIAIALLLILGINQVFSIAQQTSSAGTQALTFAENARGAAKTIGQDLSSVISGPTCPGIVIISEARYAYRNRADLLADRDGAPNTINDPSNSTRSLPQSLTAVNSRVHRIDRLMFFTRGVAPRQTSSDPNGGFVSNSAWLESFVWYGHLALPNNAATPRYGYPNPNSHLSGVQGSDFWNPGDPGTGLSATANNPNNYFASDWVLGRVPIVLVPWPTQETTSNINEVTLLGGFSPLAMMVHSNIPPARAARLGPPPNYAPTFVSSPPNNNVPIYSSRYDMALLSADGYRQLVAGNQFWWADLSGYALPPSQMNVPPVDIRYQGNPIPQRPTGPPPNPPVWMSQASAQLAPTFLRGCSQFIVEYAGDFVTQDPTNGQVIAAQPDGEVDYILDNVGTTAQPQFVRRVRWYGFPRDVTGDGKVRWQDDVVPLRDVILNAPSAGFVGVRAPENFERSLVPAVFTPPRLPALVGTNVDYSTALDVTTQGAQYICAWGWDTPNLPKPKMIRITIALDDPAGRLNDEQTYEYVFNLP